MPAETIAIASDHAAFDLKSLLAQRLRELGYGVLDLGTDGPASVDYPDFAYALAAAIRDGRVKRGVLLCGTGIGACIAVNRFSEVRGALVHDAFDTRMARQHNDANVLCLGGRTVGPAVALDCLDIFLNTEFEGGRHARRVDKLTHPKI